MFTDLFRRLSIAAFSLLAALTIPRAAARGAQAATLAEIAVRIQKSREQVESFGFTVERYGISRSGASRVVEPSETETFIFKGPLRYLERTRVTNGPRRTESAAVQEKTGTNGSSAASRASSGPPEQVRTHETRAFDGRQLRFILGDRLAEIHSPKTRDIVVGSRFDPYYLKLIGWFVPDPLATSAFEDARRAGCLPDVFTSGGYTAVRDACSGRQCTRVDGEYRIILDGKEFFHGTEKLWLDDERCFCLVKREVTNARARRLECIIETDSPIAIIDGCWVPKICRVFDYSSGASEPKVTELRLTSWRVNNHTDQQFSVSLPPYARVTDLPETLERGISFSTPVVKYTDGNGNLLDEPPEEVFKGRRARYNHWIIAATLTCAVGFLCWRHRRRQRAARASGGTV
ncbi:MAG TPA: hypothetical protein VNH11_14415 [Pirellulales bacterium]|nr:hypothetical protein [Pirellulales bacterium]